MNQITLPAADLKQALSGLSKVVSRKSSLPVLQTVRLARDVAGHVSLSATDLDAFVTYRINDPQPAEPFDVLLPFESLNKTGRGAGDVTVIAESKDKVRLRYEVAGSPLEQSVATLAPEEFPPAPNITESPVKMPGNFGETLRQAFETSSTDQSRHVLQGAYLDVQEPNCHSIISTNGRCLFAANTFKFDLKAPVNILRHKFLIWAGFLDGECELAVKPDKSSSGWVQLSTSRWNCIIKQIDGQFPKWRQVVPTDTEAWTKVQLSDAALAQMLNLSARLPGDDTENRTLQIRVDKDLHLEGRNKDDKEFTSALIGGASVTGKPVTTALNREYLQNALRCGLDEIRIHTELEPMVFCHPGKRMVIMPVRVPAAPATKPAAPKPATPEPPTPTQPVAEAQPERKTEMTKTADTPIPKANAEPDSLKSALDQIETVKGQLRESIGALNSLTSLLKQVEKDNRSTEKEVASVRQTLRSLQGMKI